LIATLLIFNFIGAHRLSSFCSQHFAGRQAQVGNGMLAQPGLPEPNENPQRARDIHAETNKRGGRVLTLILKLKRHQIKYVFGGAKPLQFSKRSMSPIMLFF